MTMNSVSNNEQEDENNKQSDGENEFIDHGFRKLNKKSKKLFAKI